MMLLAEWSTGELTGLSVGIVAVGGAIFSIWKQFAKERIDNRVAQQQADLNSKAAARTADEDYIKVIEARFARQIDLLKDLLGAQIADLIKQSDESSRQIKVSREAHEKCEHERADLLVQSNADRARADDVEKRLKIAEQKILELTAKGV